jgi:hypothetical protein
MAAKVFDRETILDLTVNMIPLAILAFFAIAFVAFNPYGDETVIVTIQLGIIGLMFVGLAAVTYYSGAAVSKAESAAEEDDTSAHQAAVAEPTAADAEEEDT